MVHRFLKADRYSHAPTSGLGRSKWALHPQGVVKVVYLGLPPTTTTRGKLRAGLPPHYRP